MSGRRRALLGAVGRRSRRNFYNVQAYWPQLAEAMNRLGNGTPWEIQCEFELFQNHDGSHCLAGNIYGRGISIMPDQNLRFRFSCIDDTVRNAIIWTTVPLNVRQLAVGGWDGVRGYLRIGTLSRQTDALVLPAPLQFPSGVPYSSFDGCLYRLSLTRTDTGESLWSAPESEFWEL